MFHARTLYTAVVAVLSVSATFAAEVRYTFNASGDFWTTAHVSGNPANPFVHSDSAWVNNGSSTSSVKTLTSPVMTATGGPVTFTMLHAYNFERNGTPDAYDGGNLRISVNGGPFTLVPGASFSSNGYVPDIDGVDGLNFEPGWNGNSGGVIQSTASLGNLAVGATIELQLAAGWDGSVVNPSPNWFIEVVEVTSVGPSPAGCTGDINSDGQVNLSDLALLLANFGTICP